MQDGVAKVERILEARAREVYLGHRRYRRLNNQLHSQAF